MQNEKLRKWKERLAKSDNYWDVKRAEMDRREKLYDGDRKLRPIVPNDRKRKLKETQHVRNIVFELVEAQVSTQIPAPKVTARHKEDERLARVIEHFLLNELDRQSFEAMNDMAERTVPIQGGVGWMVEWDNLMQSHTTLGEAQVSTIHPKQFAPQPGVYTGIEDMDWFIVKIPTTKDAVRRKYGKEVYDLAEEEPDVRGKGNEDVNEDAVTVYAGYEKTDTGIDRYTWVNDVELEDLEDYQARRLPVCASCGKTRPAKGQVIVASVPNTELAGIEDGMNDAATMLLAGRMADDVMMPEGRPDGFLPRVQTVTRETEYDGGACPWCGGAEFKDETQDGELVMLQMQTASGLIVPGPSMALDEDGNPVQQAVKIPYYKPNRYPFVLQRNVSVFGQLLGQSDVDVIADQQNTINRMELKIIDRLVKAGTRITLPDRAEMNISPEDGEIWRINAADKAAIGVYQFSGSVEAEMRFVQNVYEEARQMLGITDSFQGRKDPTATSGVARQVATAQSAGRLESKRTMKAAAYADVFRMMFQFALAYSDEPRPIYYRGEDGEIQYEEFNRYDFLKQDEDGQYYWNDQFLFSVDSSSNLGNNREAMWQELRLNLQSGAFGDPASLETLVLFWAKMEEAHYPGAHSTKEQLRKRLEEQAMQAQMMQRATLDYVKQQPQAAPGPMPGQAMQ